MPTWYEAFSCWLQRVKTWMLVSSRNAIVIHFSPSQPGVVQRCWVRNGQDWVRNCAYTQYTIFDGNFSPGLASCYTINFDVQSCPTKTSVGLIQCQIILKNALKWYWLKKWNRNLYCASKKSYGLFTTKLDFPSLDMHIRVIGFACRC